MNTRELFGNLADALRDAVPETPVFGWEDARFVTPAIYVMPAEPFIDDDGPVSLGLPFTTHWLVQIIAARGSGDEVRRRLEESVEAAVLALTAAVDPGMRLVLDSVECPKFGKHENVSFIGADIAISVSISLRES